jgi:peroxin-5
VVDDVYRADSVWGYLRTSLACAGRMDLIPLLDAQDLKALQQQLPLT